MVRDIDATVAGVKQANLTFVTPSGHTGVVQYFSFTAPVGGTECGRMVFSDLHVAAGTIPAGTVGAMKLGLRARCGALTITVEHVTWMGPDVKPEWSAREGYEIEFDGAPTLRCNLVLGTQGENHTEMGCLATAMHAVHAVAPVCEARPGIATFLDLPTIMGRHVLRHPTTLMGGGSVEGLHQEGKATAAVSALQKMVIITARVRRDGQLAEIPAGQLVPGDIVAIEAGEGRQQCREVLAGFDGAGPEHVRTVQPVALTHLSDGLLAHLLRPWHHQHAYFRIHLAALHYAGRGA